MIKMPPLRSLYILIHKDAKRGQIVVNYFKIFIM